MTPNNLQATLTRMLLTGACIPEDVADLRAHIAALEGDNAAKDEAFRLYVEERGVEHDDIPGTDTLCPEDDTCECPRIVALNAAFGPKNPGAHLLAEHAKALVRARNEGRTAAIATCEEYRMEMRDTAEADPFDILTAAVQDILQSMEPES